MKTNTSEKLTYVVPAMRVKELKMEQTILSDASASLDDMDPLGWHDEEF